MSELKLFVREPMVLTFVFAFPVLTVLILGGVFDDDDPNFEGALPSDYYVAAYIGVVIAAIGLVMLPVHLATYRERGILRRFDVSRYPRWALPAAWILVAMVITAVAVTVLLVTGHLVYGLPTPDNLLGVTVGTLLGAFTFISIGIAVGLVDAQRPVRPRPRDAAVLPVLPARRRRPTTGRDGRPDEFDRQRGAAHPCRALDPRTVARPRQPQRPPRRARRPRRRGHHRMDHPQHPGYTMSGPQPPADHTTVSSGVPAPQPQPDPQQLRADAQRWVRRLRILYTILGIYAVLSLMWFAIDMADGTESLWFYWPMLGVGLAVAVAAIVLVGIGGLFGADWENRKVERYLRQHQARDDPGYPAPPPPSTKTPDENERKEARP